MTGQESRDGAKTDRLDQALGAYYRNEHPSARIMDRLDDATRAALPARRGWWLVAVAAATAIAMAGWLGLSHAPVDLAQRIADEVAMNHQKALALEFHGDRYAQLDTAMDQLDFSIRRPEAAVLHELVRRELVLQGGRYCSIQGQLAAQIRFESEAGNRATLYQTRLTGDLRRVPPQQLVRDGVRVTLWQEAGQFLALAEAAATSDASGPRSRDSATSIP